MFFRFVFSTAARLIKLSPVTAPGEILLLLLWFETCEPPFDLSIVQVTYCPSISYRGWIREYI